MQSEASTTTSSNPLLEVDDLKVEFRMRDGVVKAVDGVSYELAQQETLAIVGESGSGKTVSAQAIMGIIDSPPGFITGGQVQFKGQSLFDLPARQRQAVRGAKISMIFQDALTALNPVFPVGWQIAEMFRKHLDMPRKDAMAEAARLMEAVRIPSAKERLRAYPHEFSGGMRQRVMIAMAIALNPDILIADEPTTALDVTVQAQIMDLLAELQEELGMGLILITHDLAVVAEVSDRVAVMYAGRIVETANIEELYRSPAHPYTLGLMQSLARADRKGEKLQPIEGSPPDLMRVPPGCAFHPRCPYATEACMTDVPELREVRPGRWSACIFAEDVING
jgi:oligopeptide transport system ATP-binding protein